MARIRSLKPEFWKDEDIAALPHQTRLFYQGLWNFADKAGRLEDRADRLKVDIFPYEEADIEGMLEALAKPKKYSKTPFINRYETGGERFIQIIAWEQHQNPHHTERHSVIPPPPITPLDNGYIPVRQQEGHGSSVMVSGNGKESSQCQQDMHKTGKVKNECDNILTWMKGLDLTGKEQTEILLAWGPGLKARTRCYDCAKCERDFKEKVAEAKNRHPRHFGAYLVKTINNHITGS